MTRRSIVVLEKKSHTITPQWATDHRISGLYQELGRVITSVLFSSHFTQCPTESYQFPCIPMKKVSQNFPWLSGGIFPIGWLPVHKRIMNKVLHLVYKTHYKHASPKCMLEFWASTDRVPTRDHWWNFLTFSWPILVFPEILLTHDYFVGLLTPLHIANLLQEEWLIFNVAFIQRNINSMQRYLLWDTIFSLHVWN